MLTACIKKELLQNLLTTRIAICYAAVFALILSSVVIRGIQYREDYRKFRDTRAAEEARTEKIKSEGTWDGPLWEFTGQIRPSPLSIFCNGLAGRINRPFYIMVMGGADELSFVYEGPVQRLLQTLDPVFITAFIVSILILFVNFDAFSGEAESGTLRLVLSNRMSRGTYMLGKALGGFISMAWPVVFTFLCSLLFLTAGLGISFTGNELVRFGLILGTVLVYLGTWFMASMILSIAAASSGMVLLLSVVAWAVMSLMVPLTGIEAVKINEPVMTHAEYLEQCEAIDAEEVKRRNSITAPLYGKHARKEITREEMQRKEHAAFLDYYLTRGIRWRGVQEEKKRMVVRQMGTGMVFARVSPVAAFLFAASHLAGTGLTDFWKSEEWKTMLYRTYKDSFENEMARRRKVTSALPEGQKPDWPAIQKQFDRSVLPSKIYPEPALGVSVGHALTDLTLLALLPVLLFLAGFNLFIRRKI